MPPAEYRRTGYGKLQLTAVCPRGEVEPSLLFVTPRRRLGARSQRWSHVGKASDSDVGTESVLIDSYSVEYVSSTRRSLVS